MLSHTEAVQLFRRRNNKVWKRLSWRLDLPADLGTDCVLAAGFTELGKATSSAGHCSVQEGLPLGKGDEGTIQHLYF